jgi:flagellar protein FlaG
MNTAPKQPEIQLQQLPEYREGYANSVQIRASVWDFLLTFGTMTQLAQDKLQINNFQGIYLSPQQAKALAGLLGQNIAQYESAFGEIKLDPRGAHGSLSVQ